METLTLIGLVDSRQKNPTVPHLREMAHEMRELAAIIMAARVPNSLAGMDVRGNLRRLDETIDRMEFQAQAALRECTTSEDEQSKLRDTIRSCDRLITLTQSLLGIISQLQECSRSLSRKQAYSGVGSILRASRVSDGAIRDVTEALSSAVASFEKASANIIGIIKDRVRSDIENIRDSQEMHLQYLIAEEHTSFLDYISGGSATWKAWSEKRSSGSATDSNYEEIRADFDTWLRKDKPVYCLSGEAGTGKSAIAHQLCADLVSSHPPSVKLGASIFVSHRGGHLNSIDPILPSMAYQLIPGLCAETLAAVKDHLCRGDRQGMRLNFETMLRDRLAAAPTTPTVLVIDGLDQCKEKADLFYLLQYLFSLPREFPWLRIFLALQPQPLVMATMTHPTFSSIVHHRKLQYQLQDSAKYVRRYIQTRVPTIPGHGEYLRECPEVLQYLAKRAGKSALYARLLVNFLDMEHDSSLVNAHYNILLTGVIYDSTLYPLDRLYLAALKYAYHTPLSLVQQDSLYSIVFGNHDAENTPIPLDRNTQTEVAILSTVNRLRSVLTITTRGEVVPLHPSFREFLLDKNRCNSQLTVNPATQMICVCISTLLHMEPITSVLKPLPPTSSLILSRSDRLRRPTPLLLWDSLLSEAHPSAQVARHLALFVPSLALAMYAWVTEFPQVMNAGMVIYRYLKQTPFLLLLQEMLPQYLIFTSYVQLWRDSMQHGVLQHFRSSLTMSDIIRRLGIYSTRPTSWTFNAGPPPNALVYLRLTIGDEELAIDILNHDYELKKLHGLMESFTHELKQATVATGGVSLAELVAGTYRIAPEE